MARNFARRNTIPSLSNGGFLAQGFDGAVLRTVAPASAILLVRKREDYYDEDEVVVDPYIQMRNSDVVGLMVATDGVWRG
jgi:hypothetical protein